MIHHASVAYPNESRFIECTTNRTYPGESTSRSELIRGIESKIQFLIYCLFQIRLPSDRFSLGDVHPLHGCLYCNALSLMNGVHIPISTCIIFFFVIIITFVTFFIRVIHRYINNFFFILFRQISLSLF